MAEVKNIKINVDTKGATKAMEDLSKATHDVSASFEEVYGDLQPLTTRMGEAEDRLYELANAGQTASKEYQDLLKTVGNYRKVQIQTDLAVDAAATTMGQKLGGALNGTTSAFAIAQGTVGIFGGELEELERVLLRVQAALAIQQGVQGVREAIPSFVQLKNVAITAFEGMTTAGKAFAVTGIGLIVTALALVATNWDKITGSTDEATKRQKAYQESIQKQSEYIGQESKEFATLISRLKSTNQGTKEREDLIKKINTQYGTTLKNLKDEAAFQSQANNELKAYLEYQKAKYRLQANEELIAKNLEKQSKLRAQIAQAQKDEQKARDDMEKSGGSNAVMIRRIQHQVELQADLNKELKDAEKRFESYGSAAQTASEAVEKLTLNGTKYIEKTAPKQKTETGNVFDPTVKAFDEAAMEIEWIDENLYKSMAARDAADIEQMNHDNQIILDSQVQLQQDLTDAELKRIALTEEAEAEKQRKFKQNLMTSIDLSIKGLNLIASIAEMNAGEDLKRQKTAFNIKKAANIASATMDGYNAVLSTFASTPGGVVLKSIAATIAGGFAAVQIAGIAKEQFNGGGTFETPQTISPTSTQQAPSFNVVGNSGFNQLAQLQQAPIQAYVVSGQVTTAQALDRNRIENATL